MRSLSLFLLITHFYCALNAQNSLPGTYLFDEPPTAIFAQTIHNDTIVCIGNVFKEGDTIHYQQGAFIAFIDSCGNLIRYRKYFDAQGRDYFMNLSNKIIRTKDGGYCFLGSLGLKNLIIKTDSKGDSVFVREYPFPAGFESSSFLSIHEINNSLYVVGYGGTNPPIEDDLFLVKFDADGNQQNYWRFQTVENCEYFQDAITKGNNIVVSASQTNACVSTFIKSKTKIFEIDTSGNLLWSWVDPGNNFKRGWGLGLKSTPDNGWIYAGANNDTVIGIWDYNTLFVTKIDSNRTHQWTKTLGFLDYNEYNFLKDIVIDSEGNYIVVGQYTTGHSDFPDLNPAVSAIVTKINPYGEILWTNIAKAFQNGPDNGLSMFTTNVNLLSSGNIIIGGYLYRTLPSDLQNEGWLAKLSPNGEVLDAPDPLCGYVHVKEPEIQVAAALSLYPNPVGDLATVSLQPGQSFTALIVYDLLGHEVMHIALPEGQTEVKFNTAALLPGFYILAPKEQLSKRVKFVVSR